MSLIQTSQPPMFVGSTRAARIVGVSRSMVERLGEDGHVGMLRLPDQYPRYNLNDVQRIVRESMIPGRQLGIDEGRPPG